MSRPIRPQLPIIETRRKWADPWQVEPYLHLETMDAAVAPTIPTAQLTWDYGLIDDAAGAGPVQYEPIAERLEDCYVRISRPPRAVEIEGEQTWVEAEPIWHGIFTASADDRGLTPASGGGPTGREQLTARGLEFLLSRCSVTGSYLSVDGSPALIDKVLPFNLPDQRADSLTGNRSAAKITYASGLQAYGFSDADGELWTAADAAEYLLAAWGPGGMAITLAGATTNLAQFVLPFGPFRSVADGLSAMIARSRGHTWRIEVTVTGEGEEATETVTCEAISCLDGDVEAGGLTLTGATYAVEFDGTDDQVRSVVIRRSAEHRYEKIVARGGPVILMGTLSVAGGTLEEAWKADTETAYKAAADEDRTAEKYSHVYRSFRAVAASLPGGPYCDGDGVLGQQLGSPSQSYLGKRLLRSLPMLAAASDSENPAEFKAPFAVASAAIGAGGADVPVLLHRLSEVVEGAPDIGMRVLDGEMGVHLDVRPNLWLAKGHFSGAAASKWTPVIDYDSLQVTAAWASDEHLQVEAELEADLTSDPYRTLLIELPECQAWWRLADTVTDVQEGAVVTAGEAELRNDRDKLAAAAALAAAWYRRRRRAATVIYDNLLFSPRPGALARLVTTADESIELNSVVTRISWNCQTLQTTVETDFAELDFSSLLGERYKKGGSPAGLRVPSLAAPTQGQIDNLQVRAPGMTAGMAMRFGKPSSAYSSGATMTLDPCDAGGADNGLENVTVQAGFTLPAGTEISTSTVVPFCQAADGKFYVVGTMREVMTAFQYDTTSHKLQKKVRGDFGLFATTESSAWIDITTAVDCTAV
jgi:hypothetical protein